MVEIPGFQVFRLNSGLGPDELQFITTLLDDLRSGLWANADPGSIRAAQRLYHSSPLRFEILAREARRLAPIELEHRFAARNNDQPPFKIISQTASTAFARASAERNFLRRRHRCQRIQYRKTGKPRSNGRAPFRSKKICIPKNEGKPPGFPTEFPHPEE